MTAKLYYLHPETLKLNFKLEQYRFKYEEEKKAIGLKLTLAIIKDILK